jgi:HAD superfamily phosphoserine phosphatase-like hydrolase
MPPTLGKVHAFFDFDDTLMAGDSILCWLRFYYSKRPKRRIFQIANLFGMGLFLLKLVDSHTLKRLYLWPVAFEDPATLDKLAQEFVINDLAKRFHLPVLERLWSHHLLGHRVIVISASATFYLKHLKALLPPVEILGTELQLPRRGLRFPTYASGNLRGSRKVEILKAMGLDQAGALGFAYSDHHHDMPLLDFAEFPTCVFPTPRLESRARSLGWPIWTWPGRPPRWQRRLHKFGLLVFGLEWLSEAKAHQTAISLPGRPGEEASFLPTHASALRERILNAYHGDEAEIRIAKVLGPKGRRLGI